MVFVMHNGGRSLAVAGRSGIRSGGESFATGLVAGGYRGGNKFG